MVLSAAAAMALGFGFLMLAATQLTASFLIERRAKENLHIVDEFALAAAPLVGGFDAEGIQALLSEQAYLHAARFLVLSPDGTVWADSLSSLNGLRLAHGEILDLKSGQANLSQGLHLAGNSWIGYYASTIVYDRSTIGIALMSTSLQDVFDQLDSIRQTLFSDFLLALLLAAALAFWLSHLIIRPINELNDVMRAAGREGFTVRARVRGRDEVAQLSQSFNAMSERLQNLDQMRNEFISNASHELKTPLSAIKVMAESLLSLETIDDGHAREFLEDINGEVDRLNLIVQDLLTLVRFDGRQLPLQKEYLSLGELVFNTVSRLAQLARRAGVELKLELDEALYIEGDPLRLSQAIYNLVDNAIKYTKAGGHIWVSLRHEGPNVVFSVKDDGIGIPRAALSHIFDRFYRVDKARSRATGGTGLGLSIVQNIIRVHDGEILVDSIEDKGTTFTVVLPAAEDPAPYDDDDEAGGNPA
ncbi:MAG: HAMP domain-containing histidine kinase [Christensenellaceae bacterium]|jgi:signal transduction histidine kinase|nr:HAMP domain-containing histidine kinase [Christensenellaceae bacterium]